MNIYKAIFLKIASSLLLAFLAADMRYLGQQMPIGQVVSFRGLGATVPVLIVYAWRRELAATLRMGRPLGHIGRATFSLFSMFLFVASVVYLPLVDATTIGFLTPLIVVFFAAIFLKERVRAYRWVAVLVGFSGVLIMLLPQLDFARFSGNAMSDMAAVGIACALVAAFMNAGSVIQTRRMTDTETTSSIVFYFSLFCGLGALATLPLGWKWPVGFEIIGLIGLGVFGGVGHILLTESYRLAPASVIAPFDYLMMLWVCLLGYFLFGEVPQPLVFVGSAIVAGAGLFVIWRERQLGRANAAKTPPAGPA
jgi:drug/metabolite transporter (DMT)-like permease